MKSCLKCLVNGFDSLFVFSALLETNKLPTLEQILQKRENEECFFVFCDHFLSRIVGITAWKEGCTKTKVSELASVTDEAFAYLLIEKNLLLKCYHAKPIPDKETHTSAC